MNKDLEFIKERNWPQWPLLPLIKRDSSRRTAVLFPHVKEDLYLLAEDANLFSINPNTFDNLPSLTAEQVIEQGWQVD